MFQVGKSPLASVALIHVASLLPCPYPSGSGHCICHSLPSHLFSEHVSSGLVSIVYSTLSSFLLLHEPLSSPSCPGLLAGSSVRTSGSALSSPWSSEDCLACIVKCAGSGLWSSLHAVACGQVLFFVACPACLFLVLACSAYLFCRTFFMMLQSLGHFGWQQ